MTQLQRYKADEKEATLQPPLIINTSYQQNIWHSTASAIQPAKPVIIPQALSFNVRERHSRLGKPVKRALLPRNQ